MSIQRCAESQPCLRRHCSPTRTLFPSHTAGRNAGKLVALITGIPAEMMVRFGVEHTRWPAHLHYFPFICACSSLGGPRGLRSTVVVLLGIARLALGFCDPRPLYRIICMGRSMANRSASSRSTSCACTRSCARSVSHLCSSRRSHAWSTCRGCSKLCTRPAW